MAVLVRRGRAAMRPTSSAGSVRFSSVLSPMKGKVMRAFSRMQRPPCPGQSRRTGSQANGKVRHLFPNRPTEPKRIALPLIAHGDLAQLSQGARDDLVDVRRGQAQVPADLVRRE